MLMKLAKRLARTCRRQPLSTGPPPPPEKPNRSQFQPPLSRALTGLPQPIYAIPDDCDNDVKQTVLGNGIKVASIPHFGRYFTVGAAIAAGSRYEGEYPSGITHILEKLAFHSTLNYGSREDLLADLESHGGLCDCQSSRDVMVYAVSAEAGSLEPAVAVLAETVLRPRLRAEEVRRAARNARYEVESLLAKPEQDLLLMDLAHSAAFGSSTLGLPKVCPLSNIDRISSSLLFTYMKYHFLPERTVVTGVGVNHADLVSCVDEYFGRQQPAWRVQPDLTLRHKRFSSNCPHAEYTGGMIVERTPVPQRLGLPEAAHLVLAMQGSSYNDPDFVPLCVLNILLGGGGSFSSGGPGKGMYSRLFTHVLNRFEWVFSAAAFNHTYSDTGLFGVQASAPPERINDLAQLLAAEMARLPRDLDSAGVTRAKTQLKAVFLMNLEVRAVVFEDVARQMLAKGIWKEPEFYVRIIERVSVEDVLRVVWKLLKSPPTVAVRGLGDEYFPKYPEIAAMFRR